LPFKKGNQLRKGTRNPNAGRKKSIKTQVKELYQAHPDRYAELMEDCYLMAKTDPDSRVRLEALKYCADRDKGRPKVSLGVAEEDRTLLTAAFLLELRKAVDTPLIEGEFEEVSDGQDPLM